MEFVLCVVVHTKFEIRQLIFGEKGKSEIEGFTFFLFYYIVVP